MSGYAGTGALLKLALRRDRVVIPLSVLGLVAFAGGSAKSTVDLYQGQNAIDAARALLASPAIVGMYGPIANPDNPDSFAIFKTLLLGLGMRRPAGHRPRPAAHPDRGGGRPHRAGRRRRGRTAGAPHRGGPPRGRHRRSSAARSPRSASSGPASGPRGSWAFGLAWATVGLTFTGVAAVAAQLTTTTRGAGAWAFGALGVSYLLRAIGDTASGPASWLTWLSPLGWAEKIEVFGADRFVVAVIPLVVTVLLIGLAFALQERRDFGAGLLPARPGPAGAAPALRSPWALAWRLQRANLFGWVIGYVVVGTVLGGVAGSVSSIASSEQMQDLLRKLGGNAASLTDTFISTELQFLAIGAAAYGISAALRLRSEENDLHTEQVLATSTRRYTVLASHSVIALLGSALLMLVLALAAGARHARAVRRLRCRARPPAAECAGDDPAGLGMRRAGPRDLRLGAQGRLRRVGAAGGVRRRRRVRPAVQPAAAGHRRVAVRPRAWCCRGRASVAPLLACCSSSPARAATVLAQTRSGGSDIG